MATKEQLKLVMEEIQNLINEASGKLDDCSDDLEELAVDLDFSDQLYDLQVSIQTVYETAGEIRGSL